ncbi:hypothetical protein GA0116948_1183 [Chitinophaga costaii]|uniref:Uncharacterized protein n=1 Tax=Chitinophaga costaii TaxID=1335309 RepID=A0A1C4FX79_9BACT|nr:hypothetical protein GA0116948_1183 [Chitinophaga costaii]
MTSRSVGSQWLKEKYNLTGYILTHCSFIGSNDSIEVTNKGNIEQVYSRKYATVKDTPLLHLEFSSAKSYCLLTNIFVRTSNCGFDANSKYIRKYK